MYTCTHIRAHTHAHTHTHIHTCTRTHTHAHTHTHTITETTSQFKEARCKSACDWCASSLNTSFFIRMYSEMQLSNRSFYLY